MEINVSPFAIWGQTETSSPCIGDCSSLVKLQLSLMISLILMTPRTIYRVSFGSFQLTSACGGVQRGDNRNFWVNQLAKTAQQEHQWSSWECLNQQWPDVFQLLRFYPAQWLFWSILDGVILYTIIMCQFRPSLPLILLIFNLTCVRPRYHT